MLVEGGLLLDRWLLPISDFINVHIAIRTFLRSTFRSLRDWIWYSSAYQSPLHKFVGILRLSWVGVVCAIVGEGETDLVECIFANFPSCPGRQATKSNPPPNPCSTRLRTAQRSNWRSQVSSNLAYNFRPFSNFNKGGADFHDQMCSYLPTQLISV